MKIVIDSKTVEKCRKFAEDRLVLSANCYKWRGEQNKSKMIEDILVGTLGEFGVYEYLKQKGIQVSEPDLKIYEQKRKSHSADLQSEEFKFHVKSQTSRSISRYGHSYLFQQKDKLVLSPSAMDFVCFTSVDLDGRVVEVHGVVKGVDLVPFYSECKVPMYRHTKCALYLKDFQDKINLESL